MRPSRPVPIHPLLFVLFPVVSLYARNRGEVTFAETLVPSSIVLAAAAAVWLLLSLLLRDTRRAALVTSVLVLVTFSYAPIDAVLRERGFESWMTATLLACAGLIASALIVRRGMKDSRPSFVLLTRAANVAAFCALVAAVVPLASAILAPRPPQGANFPELAEVDRAFAAAGSDVRPDIFYLMFDQYGSEEVLAKHFRYDNAPFLAWLRSRGFYVAGRSVANYPRTSLAIGANLNLLYIHRVTRRLASAEVDWQPLYRFVEDHRIGRFLQKQGYRYVHMGSWWPVSAKSPIADLNINPNVVVDFGTLLFRNTIFYAFIEEREESYELRREQWRTEREKLARLPQLSGEGEPLFVFAHFLVTHAPYVFSPEGEFISRETAKKMTREQLYAAQIEYTNRELQRIITLLQERGRKSGLMPVIIIQADEGPYPSKLDNPSRSFDWRTATAEEFAHKSGILNAMYLPGKEAEALLWPSMTPVNTFRVVSNAYFGTKFPMLPDQQFVYENEYHNNRFYRRENDRWVEDR